MARKYKVITTGGGKLIEIAVSEKFNETTEYYELFDAISDSKKIYKFVKLPKRMSILYVYDEE